MEARTPDAVNGEQGEAYRCLLDMTRRRTGSIPGEMLAEHITSISAHMDWPVQRAAMEALLRRLNFAHRDQ